MQYLLSLCVVTAGPQAPILSAAGSDSRSPAVMHSSSKIPKPSSGTPRKQVHDPPMGQSSSPTKSLMKQPSTSEGTARQGIGTSGLVRQPSGMNGTAKQLDGTSGLVRQPSGTDGAAKQPNRTNGMARQPVGTNGMARQPSRSTKISRQPNGNASTGGEGGVTCQPSGADSLARQPSMTNGRTRQPSAKSSIPGPHDAPSMSVQSPTKQPPVARSTFSVAGSRSQKNAAPQATALARSADVSKPLI